jgi:hypothetical protein
MADRYPTDRFDDIPVGGRIGAHRAPPRRGGGWVRFAWAALATGILVAAGVIGLSLLGPSGDVGLPFVPASASPSESVAPSVAPSLDAAVPITVLNGTTTTGLAGAVGDLLVDRGWGGAAIGIGTRAGADESDIRSTVVYYGDASHEAAAKALVEDLGVGVARQSDRYPESPVTVVLGYDYVLPTP